MEKEKIIQIMATDSVLGLDCISTLRALTNKGNIFELCTEHNPFKQYWKEIIIPKF